MSKRKSTNIRVIYCNVNRSIPAHDILLENSENIGANVICCSEPNWGWIQGNHSYVSDPFITVAMTSREWINEGDGNGFVWIDCGVCIVYTCYISPNVDNQAYITFLTDLRNDIKRQTKEVVITGDFNAWATAWGCRTTDARGRLLTDWISETDMLLVNRGLASTCIRHQSESVLDLTLCTKGLWGSISNWAVMEEAESLSDHVGIRFDICGQRDTRVGPVSPALCKFRVEHMEPIINYIRDRIPINPSAEDLNNLARDASVRIIGYRRNTTGKNGNPWWDCDLSRLRDDSIRARRRLSRFRRSTGYVPDIEASLISEYMTHKRSLRKAIVTAKELYFTGLLSELNRNPWGKCYKMLVKKGRVPKIVEPEEQLRLARELFPVHNVAVYKPTDGRRGIPFSELELLAACSKLKSGKSPGPDQVPVEVTRIICMEFKEQCLSAFNDCLFEGGFPECWKTTKLILIEKPKKNKADPPSFRPICLTNTLGKVYEYMVQYRIRSETREPLDKAQFGFRKGLSTVDAISKVLSFGKVAKAEKQFAAIVAVDIKNAFNTVPWVGIDEALERKGTPGYLRRVVQAYLTKRTLLVGGEPIPTSAGVPQGSVLGPLLWCMFYDSILRMEMERGVEFCCYADDLAILVAAKKRTKLVGRTNRAILLVTEKLRQMGLQVADSKTESILLNSKRNSAALCFKIGMQSVNTTEHMKYLGIILSRDLKFAANAEEAAAKATRTSFALSAIMPNSGGPGQAARRVQSTAVTSALLYGCQSWYEFVSQEEVWSKLASGSRGVLLRVCRGYRTMSTAAAEILAGVPPIRLRAEELMQRFRGLGAADARRRRDEQWMDQWRVNQEAKWTHRLIPSPEEWLMRRHGEIDRWITTTFSGQGPYYAYLKKLELSVTDECPMCYEEDTVEHAVFTCRRWRMERRDVDRAFGVLSPDTIMSIMLDSEEAWRAVADCLRKIHEGRREADLK